MSENNPMGSIETSAEIVENAILPTVHEVHLDPAHDAQVQLPAKVQASAEKKSPARWAYERLILYIQNFEKQLDTGHEVALGMTGSDAGVIRIEGLGYFDPDLITFYGTNQQGTRTQLVQHVTQLNVMLMAMPKAVQSAEPTRIGFKLARELEQENDATV